MNVLLLEPDLRLAKALSTRLGGDDRVLDLTEIAEAESMSLSGELSVVFGEASYMPRLREFAARGAKVAVWTSSSVDPLVLEARESGISVIATKTHPILLDELVLASRSWVDGIRPGVSKFLASDHQVAGTLEVDGSADVGEACRSVLATLPGTLGTSRRLRLVLDELLTNSIHHAGGSSARLEWGSDGIRWAFAIRDGAGMLDPDEALRVLDRHLHGEGLLDSRGRGLHLSRIYADRLYVSVVPGRLTESAAVFWNRPGAFQGFKPVWILSTERIKED